MDRRELKIGILEVGRPPPELASEFAGYGEQSAAWLAPLGGIHTVYRYDEGERPASVNDQDLWLITGSRRGTYEDLPWIAELEDFVRSCRDAGRPMVGICFGHQIIAQALGGVVRKSDKGWGLGVHDYEIIDWPAQLGPAPDGLHIQALHQDQVEEAPQDAVRIARSDFCENAALWYPGFALTVQGHPELNGKFVTKVAELRRGSVFSDSEADAAIRRAFELTNAREIAMAVAQAFAKEKMARTET